MAKEKTKRPELSIVLPMFNEEENVPHIVERYARLAKKTTIEVIIVEDSGSSDDTRGALRRAARTHSFLKPLFTTERGYGVSIRNGLAAARGEYVCWTHADLQTAPEDTVKALAIIKKQPDAKQCYIKGDRYGRPLLDRFLAFGMTVFEAILFQKPFWDINAQPTLAHRSFLPLLLKDAPNDFAFDLYAYHKALTSGYRVIRFDVHFGKRIYGKSSWNTGLLARIKFIKRTMKFSLELRRKV